MLRLTAILLAIIGSMLGFACGTSYLLASRTASRAALRIAPDLGAVGSEFGFHHRGAGEGSTLSWEFSYGPSGELGPVTLQLYIGLAGHLYQTHPPEALEQLKPSRTPASQ